MVEFSTTRRSRLYRINRREKFSRTFMQRSIPNSELTARSPTGKRVALPLRRKDSSTGFDGETILVLWGEQVSRGPGGSGHVLRPSAQV